MMLYTLLLMVAGSLVVAHAELAAHQKSNVAVDLPKEIAIEDDKVEAFSAAARDESVNLRLSRRASSSWQVFWHYNTGSNYSYYEANKMAIKVSANGWGTIIRTVGPFPSGTHTINIRVTDIYSDRSVFVVGVFPIEVRIDATGTLLNRAKFYGMQMTGNRVINGAAVDTVEAARLGDIITIEYNSGTKQVVFWKNGRDWSGPLTMSITDEQATRVYPVFQLYYVGDAVSIY